MAMEPMPQQGAPASQGGGDPGQAISEMAVGTDQAINQLAQVLGQQNPQVGEALAQLSSQFRKIIESAMTGGGGQSAPQAQGIAPSETGGREDVQQVM